MKRLLRLVEKLQTLAQKYNNVYTRSAGVFTGACVSDFVWAKYMSGVASGTAFAAANWGAVVIVMGAYLVVSYVEDKRLIIPAALGAWVGTYVAV